MCPTCVLLVLLCKVAEAGKDEDAHGQEEHEEAELLVAVLQGEGDGLEAGGVARQLEDAHDPHDAEDLDDPADVVEGGARLRGGHLRRRCRGRGQRHRLRLVAHKEEGDVVGEDGEDVHHVHGALSWQSVHVYQLKSILFLLLFNFQFSCFQEEFGLVSATKMVR